MLSPIRTPGNMVMLAVGMLFALPGCATMVATSGISGLHEIPTELIRKEVQERFGSPASAGTTAAGRATETFNIRRRIDPHSSVSEAYGSGVRKSWDDFKLACIVAPPFCAALWLYGGMYAVVGESLLTPFALAESELNKMEVAFVYGPDDRVLYFYEPKAGPYSRPSQALRTLTHPLSSETELAKCPSVKECMQRYVRELQARAVEVGYTLTNKDEDEEAFRRDFELARNVDDGKVTRVEVVRRRAIYLLESSFLKEIAERFSEGKCQIVAYCIAPDAEVVRRRAAEINYPLTPREEEFFQLQLKLAKDVDDGKITKEEMIKRAGAHFTKLNIH